MIYFVNELKTGAPRFDLVYLDIVKEKWFSLLRVFDPLLTALHGQNFAFCRHSEIYACAMYPAAIATLHFHFAGIVGYMHVPCSLLLSLLCTCTRTKVDVCVHT